MRYMLLICADPSLYDRMTKAEQDAMFQEYYAVTQEMDRRGVHIGGAPLQPIHTATTVRLRNGKILTTDGPFAELQEHLVGYYVLECKDLDEALDFAAKIPDARVGAVEVRPIRDLTSAA